VHCLIGDEDGLRSYSSYRKYACTKIYRYWLYNIYII